jgi:hypothetical protein
MICHVNFVPYNPRIKKRRGIRTYFNKNGITTLKKHVDTNHVVLAKRFEEEMNLPLRNIFEKQPTKKRPMCLTLKYQSFLVQKILSRGMLCIKSNFCKNLILLVIKNHLLIQFVDSTWLKCLVMHLCPRVVFPSRKKNSQEVLVDLVKNTKEKYVLLKLKQCYSTTTSFYLWMSKGAHDVFALVISFLNEEC